MQPEAWPAATADLCDQLGEAAQILALPWRTYGGHATFCGRAATFRAEDDTHLIRAILERPGNGQVLVIHNGGGLRRAVFGGRFAKLMQANGWAGAVIHGALRDTLELAATPVGCVALGTSPRRPLKEGRGEGGIRLDIEGVAVRPGDWVAVDPDGVVVVALDNA